MEENLGSEGTATATAVATERDSTQFSDESSNLNDNKLVRSASTNKLPPTDVATDEKTDDAGFALFRFWANRQIRSLPGGVTLMYGGHDHTVTEITADGRVRLEYQGSFNLIPLDERVIPKLFQQIL